MIYASVLKELISVTSKHQRWRCSFFWVLQFALCFFLSLRYLESCWECDVSERFLGPGYALCFQRISHFSNTPWACGNIGGKQQNFLYEKATFLNFSEEFKYIIFHRFHFIKYSRYLWKIINKGRNSSLILTTGVITYLWSNTNHRTNGIVFSIEATKWTITFPHYILHSVISVASKLRSIVRLTLKSHLRCYI